MFLLVMFVGSIVELYGMVGWIRSDVVMPSFFWPLIIGLQIRDICQVAYRKLRP